MIRGPKTLSTLVARQGARPDAHTPRREGFARVFRGIGAVRIQCLVLLLFLALAVLLLGSSTWTSPTAMTRGAGLGDPGVFIWFLGWTPFALGRHISPFYSDWLNHPDGINLMWNTWVPLPGLLLAPLTARWGPVLTLNVLLVLAFGLSSWSAYLAIRRYVPSHGAAVVGGLVYGFSPAMRAHVHHLNLILVFLLPLLLVLVDEILVRQRRSVVWLGVVLGLLSAAQVLIGEELFVATVLLSVVLLLVLMVMHPRAVSGRARYALTAIAIALLVFGVLMALPLKAQLTGPARIQSDITAETHGASDLLAPVMPNRTTAIFDTAAATRLRTPLAGSTETYLGIPLLLMVLAVAVVQRSRPLVRVGFAMLLACLLLSLGAQLRVGGDATGVWLPWAVMESLPLLNNIVPARLALFTALFAGLLLAVGLNGLWQAGGWWRRSLAVVAAAAVFAFLVPPGPLRPGRVKTPPFFTTAAVRTLPRDGVALVVPFPGKGRHNQAMVWQAEAGMWFKMPGGYFVGPDPDGGTRHDAPPTTTSITLNRIQRGWRPPKLTPELRQRIAEDLATWRVDSVVLGPMQHREAMTRFLTDLLGRPPQTIGGVQVWRNPTTERTANR
jgi:hypothetical protein